MYTSPTTIGLYLIKLRQVRVIQKIQSELNQRVVWSTNLLSKIGILESLLFESVPFERLLCRMRYARCRFFPTFDVYVFIFDCAHRGNYNRKIRIRMDWNHL